MPALAGAAAMRLVPGADVANLSFHARVPAYAPLRQYKRLVEHHLASYVTFLFSGNGNLDFGLGRMSTLWDDAARGLPSPRLGAAPAPGRVGPGSSPITMWMPGGPAWTSS